MTIGDGRMAEADVKVSATALPSRDGQAELVSERLAAIVTSSDDAIIAKTLDGTILSWNPAAERMYGYPAAEAVGAHISMLVPSGQRDELHGILARLGAGESVKHFETVRRRRDGSHIDVSLTISPVRDTAGTIVGASTIARDVSEHRALARQLRASEELYRTTIDDAPIGIAIIAMDGRWLRANRALCAMTGHSAEALLASSFLDLTHPDDVASSVELTRQLLSGEIALVETEKRYVRADGSTMWAQLTVSLARDHAGTPLHRVAQIQDITARRNDHDRLQAHVREQEALRAIAVLVASEAQPRVVFASAAQHLAAILTADVAGVVRLELTGEGRLVGSWSRPDLTQELLGGEIDRSAGTAAAEVLRSGRVTTTRDVDLPSSHLAAPIEVNGKVWGAVEVSWSSLAPIDDRAPERLARVADLISLAATSADAREQLSLLASTDHLTGLYNQRAFCDRLDAEVGRARRHGRALSLVVFDIDHFKLVNDTHGHEVGNRALADFADRLRATRRDGETVARVGGEEFAWILPETDGEGALAAAERARQAIAAGPFTGVGRLTVSAGVCALQDASDAREMFRHADLALYWAKSNGRNTVFRYSSSAFSLMTADEQAVRLERARTLAAVRALATAVDAKDSSTQRHSERVADLAADLARCAGWERDRVALLRDAALVHDVGKIAIPDRVLLKPGKLTDAEYELVKTHSTVGAEMIADLLSAEQVDWIRHHHERMDGTGYPDRLTGDEITPGARILAVADAWDAMTAARCYGAPKPTDVALRELQVRAAEQFCPEVVAAVSRMFERPSEARIAV